MGCWHGGVFLGAGWEELPVAPSGARAPFSPFLFLGKGVPLKLNQPKRDADYFFPMQFHWASHGWEVSIPHRFVKLCLKPSFVGICFGGSNQKPGCS